MSTVIEVHRHYEAKFAQLIAAFYDEVRRASDSSGYNVIIEPRVTTVIWSDANTSKPVVTECKLVLSVESVGTKK